MARVSPTQDKKAEDSQLLTLQVPIAPRPASRPRFSSKGCVYTDSTYKRWLTEFKDQAQRLWKKATLQRCSHMEVVFNGVHKRGDLDNYLKAALDGLVYAGVIKNDNLTVLDSIETRYITIHESDPWIVFNIQT